jgi:hypothetical protein
MIGKFLSFVLIFVSFGCLKEKLEIISNPAYAIGTVDVYSDGGRQRPSVHFHYGIKNGTYYGYYVGGQNGWSIPAPCDCSSGHKFMVQYDSLDVSAARMLFGYPVSDSLDYKKYLTVFKKTPPGH